MQIYCFQFKQWDNRHTVLCILTQWMLKCFRVLNKKKTLEAVPQKTAAGVASCELTDCYGEKIIQKKYLYMLALLFYPSLGIQGWGQDIKLKGLV